jgi:hypothetical protein
MQLNEQTKQNAKSKHSNASRVDQSKRVIARSMIHRFSFHAVDQSVQDFVPIHKCVASVRT